MLHNPVCYQGFGLGLLSTGVFLYTNASAIIGVTLVCIWHQCCLVGFEDLNTFGILPLYYFGGSLVSLLLHYAGVSYLEILCASLGCTIFLAATILLAYNRLKRNHVPKLSAPDPIPPTPTPTQLTRRNAQIHTFL